MPTNSGCSRHYDKYSAVIKNHLHIASMAIFNLSNSATALGVARHSSIFSALMRIYGAKGSAIIHSGGNLVRGDCNCGHSALA